MHLIQRKFSTRKQAGMALFVALIILILLSVIGINAMMTTTMEEKMAGNTRDHYLAFQAAETGLIAAEDFVETLVTLAEFSETGNNGLFLLGDPDDPVPSEVLDWESSNKLRVISDNLQEVYVAPKYIVEHTTTLIAEEDNLNLGNYGEGTGAGTVEVFRITAYGKGGVAGSRVLLQTHYGKKL